MKKTWWGLKKGVMQAKTRTKNKQEGEEKEPYEKSGVSFNETNRTVELHQEYLKQEVHELPLV